MTTQVSLSVRQALGARFDLVARASRGSLDYSGRVTADAGDIVVAITSGEARRDRTESYGAGIGFWLVPGLRVGFDGSQQRRDSPRSGLSYEGYPFGGSLSYGGS